jgi:sugar/nucleoside kinase (ribokinase family)
MTKILGIGNALVDILAQLDDDQTLEKFSLPKGSMQLVNAERSKEILKGISHLDKKISSGGSAANTIHGLAKLGVETSFIGTVGEDRWGDLFRNDMESHNIEPRLFTSKSESGRAVALISPDSERTFATFLGAAAELNPDQITAAHFTGFDIFHMEGYLVQNHDLVETAFAIAKQENLLISLDLASYNIVEENVHFLREVARNYVDILFANEEEAKSFTGKHPEEALIEMADMCDIAVVKTGKKGSLVKGKSGSAEIGIVEVESVDTTGAGDLYASGFLYGMTEHLSLAACGKLGALLSGKVIEVIGAKLDESQWREIRNQLNRYDAEIKG